MSAIIKEASAVACPIVEQHVAKYGFPFVVTSVDKIRALAHYEALARSAGEDADAGAVEQT